jgi:hypothetical protein
LQAGGIGTLAESLNNADEEKLAGHPRHLAAVVTLPWLARHMLSSLKRINIILFQEIFPADRALASTRSAALMTGMSTILPFSAKAPLPAA